MIQPTQFSTQPIPAQASTWAKARSRTATTPPQVLPLCLVQALARGLLATSLLVVGRPALVQATEDPVDVPITRGKVDLGLKPNLAQSGNGPSGSGTKTADTATAAPVATPSARPKPRTVADYAAEAKAKAAAEAVGKGQAPSPAEVTSAPPDTSATLPHTAATPVRTPQPIPHSAMSVDKAADKPADPTNDKSASKAVAKPAAKPLARAAAPAKAPDEGLDKIAIKLVEAMARASAKQDKRETATRPSAKKLPEAHTATPAAHSNNSAHGSAHWTYEGDTGPANWAKIKPDFNTCAIGLRQSPIPIDDSTTLQGPAEPIGFAYQASEGSVVNNGHTIQVDLAPANNITVRSGLYQLLQFHFHHPSEEQINGKRYDMVAHLVHQNAEGQLAVVAVLLTPGEANPAIETVWKHMPLDTGDRVKLPAGALNLSDLLPKDQRYYQFMGSLTTPPCTEGVLWMVLKTPVTLSPAQIRLFGQLFPHNARPVQELNGRPVREGL